MFTALHRLLGRPPGEITDALLDDAVTEGLRETDDLDWKRELPAPAGLPSSDFPKDIAAMANNGGGLIVYGVTEQDAQAAGRHDVGDMTDAHERALRSAAYNTVTPPVFGIDIVKIGTQPPRAVAVHVGASIDVPHLIYKGHFFGAPIRNGTSTEWMKESQVAAMYRARFEEHRNAHEALDTFYDDMSTARSTTGRAWLIGVCRPRTPALHGTRLSRDDARRILTTVERGARQFLDPRSPGTPSYFQSLNAANPRARLRGWVAPPVDSAQGTRNEAWAAVHDDGSVAIAAAVGGQRTGQESYAAGSQISSRRVEWFAAELVTLLQAAADQRGTGECLTKIGIEWAGEGALVFTEPDTGQYEREGPPIPRYGPIITSIRPQAPQQDLLRQVGDLATDLVNQGGIQNLYLIATPESTDADNA